MKYIKTYENSQKPPKIGDYVAINPSKNLPVNNIYINIIKDFLKNNIGQIINIKKEKVMFPPGKLNKINYMLAVKYENVPEDVSGFFKNNIKVFNLSSVAAFGKTKEEVEIKLSANKYNL